IAFQKEDEFEEDDLVLPVMLGDRQILVQAQPLLRKRFPLRDGRGVDRFCIEPEHDADIATQAKTIASDLANSIYAKIGTSAAGEAIINFDQRGDGPHSSDVELPEHLRLLDAPALVFRPSPGEQSKGRTMHGDEWEKARDQIIDSLKSAFGRMRGDTRK